MRRFLSLLTALSFALLAQNVSAATDLSRKLANYYSQIEAHQYLQAANSAADASALYAQGQNYEGAFNFLNNVNKALAGKGVAPDSLPEVRYLLERARFKLYRRMGNNPAAERILGRMGNFARKAGKTDITADMLFNEARQYFATGNTEKGTRCMERLMAMLGKSNSDAATDTLYRRIIDKAIADNAAPVLGYTYESYIKWTDSIETANADTELAKARRQYTDALTTISEKDSTIAARTGWIVTFAILFAVAVGVAVILGLLYLRIMVVNKRLRRRLDDALARNEAKNAILHNMSSRIDPALDRLDSSNPTVKSLRRFVERIGELADVENASEAEASEASDVNLESFCENIASQIRPLLKPEVSLTITGARGIARINGPEVEKILIDLLTNAAKATPAGGKITLAYKKRGAKSHQFIVTDSGSGVAEELRDNLFIAFANHQDLAEGTGLGLPISAGRAAAINGSLVLDTPTASGASFTLNIHS